MILLLWFYKRLNLISEVKLFINKVDIIDNMKDLYIGYYPITELEIKELMKLIISYKKYDYNNVLKTLKKLNCTSKQQDYVNTILSNCMLNKNTDFFDTQYGFYIAQLQKLYRKHFTMENVSLTQLLNRMHSLNVYQKKWDEIFTFSDVKYLNYLKLPKSSGVFVPFENVKKLYKSYFNNSQTKKFIDDYYGINTRKFLNILEFCVNNKCGLLEAFDIAQTSTITKTEPSKKSNSPIKKAVQKQQSSNPFYSASIPEIPEFENTPSSTSKRSSNLIYDISEFDDSDISPASNFSSFGNNFSSNIYAENDIISTPQFERKTSNLIYDVDLNDYEDDLYSSNTIQTKQKTSNLIYDVDLDDYDDTPYSSNNSFANVQTKPQKSSNLIYDVDLDDYEDDEEDTDEDLYENSSYKKYSIDDSSSTENSEYSPFANKIINDYNNKTANAHKKSVENKPKSTYSDAHTPVSNVKLASINDNKFTDAKEDNFFNANNDRFEENFEERLQKINDKKHNKKSKNNTHNTIRNDFQEENDRPLPEEEKMADFKRKNQQEAEQRKYKSKASKWFPITLVMLILYLIFNVGIQCVYEFAEPYLFKSIIDYNKITYISIGIHFVLNVFMWLLVTALSLKNKIIRKKDRKKILLFIIIFMVAQIAGLFYVKNIRVNEMTNQKINDITNFNTEYEISKLNQEIDELQSSKYSNNNITRAKIKELQSNLSEYDYYLNTKKEQSEIIKNDFNNYYNNYKYYIIAINVLMLPLIYKRLRKRTEKADFI